MAGKGKVQKVMVQPIVSFLVTSMKLLFSGVDLSEFCPRLLVGTTV